MNWWKNLKKATYIQIIASIAQNTVFPIYTETNLWCFFLQFPLCTYVFVIWKFWFLKSEIIKNFTDSIGQPNVNEHFLWLQTKKI